MAVVAMSFVCVRVVMVMVVRMSVGRRVGVTAVHGALRSAEQTAGLRRFEEIHDLGTGRKAEGDVFKMMCVHDRIHDEAVHRHGHVHEAVLYNGWPVLVAEGMSELDAALDELPETDDTVDRLLGAKLRGDVSPEGLQRAQGYLLRRGYSWDDIRTATERYLSGKDTP